MRAMASTAAERGWGVAVLNMRACGGSPVSSPRFFSAYRGSTDDMRQAVSYLRREHLGSNILAVIGWSNGGSVVNNYLAECATSHTQPEFKVNAAASLVCPLNMTVGAQNLQRWFHAAVYDRAIGSNLASKLEESRHLFVDATGKPRAVPRWEGLAVDGGSAGTFVPDLELGCRARKIRDIDEAITRRCFGFGSVDEYYAHASSDQRLSLIDTPTMLLSASDDPISPSSGVPWYAAYDNHNLLLVSTRHGGHLGWCDSQDPTGEPVWVQRVTMSFLEAACL